MSRPQTIAYMRTFPILETYQVPTQTLLSREQYTTLCELFIAISDKVAMLDDDLADTTLEALDDFIVRNLPDYAYDIELLNAEFVHIGLFFRLIEPSTTQSDVIDLETSDLTQSDLENLDFSNLDSGSLDPDNMDFSGLDFNSLDLPHVDTSANLEAIPSMEGFDLEPDFTYVDPTTVFNHWQPGSKPEH